MSCGNFYPLVSSGEKTLLDQIVVGSSELTSQLGLDFDPDPILAGSAELSLSKNSAESG